MSDQNCYLNPSHLYFIAVNIVDFLKWETCQPDQSQRQYMLKEKKNNNYAQTIKDQEAKFNK